MIKAEIILDSISPNGDRLTTMELTHHRFILAEIATHRVASTNGASSRAIPVHKRHAEIAKDLAYPVQFGTAQSGMQAGPPLEGYELFHAQQIWREAAESAITYAEQLLEHGVHKEVVNRLTEPFAWQRTIFTATEWDNFFGLRAHPDAQPEFRELAFKMKEAYENSTPTPLGYGEWHLPYITDEDRAEVGAEDLKKISAARVARVSYLNHDGKRELSKDIELFERLSGADPMHASPLEPVATPVDGPCPGNFKGWAQYRHIISGEYDLNTANLNRSLDHNHLIGMRLDFARLATEGEGVIFLDTFDAMYNQLYPGCIYAVVQEDKIVGVYRNS